MKAATLNQIKKELEIISPQKLMALTLRLVKHKVENKELISYLLFDEDDLSSYITDIKFEIVGMLNEVGYLQPYMVKRTLRKSLKLIAKYVKYTGSKDAEAELLVHFCKLLHQQGISKYTHKAILTIYINTIEKIKKILPLVHEELRYDFEQDILSLSRY